MSPRYVTTREAAAAIGWSAKTLLRWVRKGAVIPTYRTPSGYLQWDVDDLRRQIGQPTEGAPVTATTPVERPIVAAVVTSPLGMLVTWRNDKQPPAGFLTGEIEPGESPADAMVRECKEEARLRVVPGDVVGDRVHPRTGRRMIYVSGTVADERDAEVSVGDDEELAAVRWVSLADADAAFEPFGGMYQPVHEHLRRSLAE